jgi:hypothetical protein
LNREGYVSPTTRRIASRLLIDACDEIKAAVKGASIAGMDNTDRVRQVAQSTIAELFVLMSRRRRAISASL